MLGRESGLFIYHIYMEVIVIRLLCTISVLSQALLNAQNCSCIYIVFTMCSTDGSLCWSFRWSELVMY